MNNLLEFFDDPATKIVLGLLAISLAITVAIYVLGLIRRVYLGDNEKTSEWGSFREMREEGTLREYEYQHLRRKMAEKQEIEKPSPNDNNENNEQSENQGFGDGENSS